jgi:hypothetical protein
MMEGLMMLDPEAYPDPTMLPLDPELLAQLVPASS